MKYTIDTEFHDRGHNKMDLLSVGVVSESGHQYYAVVKDVDWEAVHKNVWLRDNVVPVLYDPRSVKNQIVPYRTRKEIVGELAVFFARDPAPQFWAYFADWDWVLFCHLFGTLLETLPQFPQLCLDIKQEMMRMRIPREALSPQATHEHNALNDAAWNMQILKEIALREVKQSGYSWLS